MRLRACILAIAVVTPLRAFAQTPPPAPPPEAAPPPPPPAVVAPPPEAVPPPPPPVAVAAPMAPAAPAAGPKFTWGGLVDAYYMFNFIRQDVAGVTADTLTPPAARAFDTNSNSATMSLAALSLNAAMDPVTFQLDFGYGATGTIINAAASNPPVTPPGMNTTTPPSFVLLQAYGSVAVAPMVTLDFGKFYTTAGAEVIPANKNWLYSRSLLFNSIPLLHTGARANIKVNDMLTLQASVVNGWNDDPDVNAWKTFGASASITPNKMATIVATTYIGKEGPQAAGETSGDLRVLIDAVLALTLSDKLGINFNVDYIKAPANIAADYLIGGAGMLRFAISDMLALAGRFEAVDYHTDLGGVNTMYYEGTGMLGITFGKNFELRPEFRFDFNSGDAMLFAGGTKKNQLTGTLAALAYF
ncbi:MAG TPA: outer membrane beta-barrel protein [Polyangia bacterium]|jgi:hypothetical protein